MTIKGQGLLRATLFIGSTLTVMAGAIVAPALPQISREFAHVPGIDLLGRLVLTLPALFMGLLAPVAGVFTDRAGRKKVLLISLLLYAFAGTTGLYVQSFFWLLAGRALLGIAVGGLITAIITLIGDYFEGEERNRFMGLQATFAGLGGLVFISSGGVLADIHWRLPFFIYISALIVLVMALISVYEPAREKKVQPSVAPGKFSMIPPMVFFVYGMAFFSMIVFYMIPVQMPFILSEMQGVTNTRIGFAIAFVNVASVITSLNYGSIRRRFGFPVVMGGVYLLVSAGFVVISLALSYWYMVLGIILSGLGFGLMMPNINLWLISLAPAALRGTLVGFLNMFVFVGMFFSPIALQPLINRVDIYFGFRVVALVLIVLSGLFFALHRLSGSSGKGS